MHPRDRVEYRIGALKDAGLWRRPEPDESAPSAAGLVDARSNDYLGLAGRGVSRETTGPIGAGASRLVSGSHTEHRELEGELAEWLGFEDCLLFSSGYAANLGVISALAGPGEIVLSDALNHASIIDGCRLSRAEVVVLPHRDVGALERALEASRGVRWVVTESYFGMDGDSPDLVALRRICDAHEAALIVDEAHAIGVFGPEGRGLSAALGVTADVLVGGMGKALGIHGGFAACAGVYREWLWNRARSLVFSTAPSPLLCALASGRVQQVRRAEPERAHLRQLEQRLSERLSQAGVETPPGRHGPLFPVILGSENAVLEGARRARDPAFSATRSDRRRCRQGPRACE
jgi:8-amino-7-oxononanoate synthase